MNIAKTILKNRKTSSFYGAVIVGLQGCGKTTLALNVAREIIIHDTKCSNLESWDEAMKLVVHSFEELLDRIEGATYNNKRKLIIWDDAGVSLGTYAHTKGFATIDDLQGVINLIRTSVEALIITTPALSGLVKFLREYNFYKIEITKAEGGGWQRRATTRHLQNSKSGKRWFKTYSDVYSCYMPQVKFDKYNEYREGMMTTQIIKTRKHIALRNKKNKRDDLKLDNDINKLKEKDIDGN